MIDRKRLFKIVRASSLQVGDSIAYRLKDDEISVNMHIRRNDPKKEAERKAFLNNPYRVCEIRQIRTFGKKLVIIVRRYNPGGGSNNYTMLTEADSYQGLYAGSTEGTLP